MLQLLILHKVAIFSTHAFIITPTNRKVIAMGSLDTLDRIILLMNEKNYNQQILTDYLGVDKSIFSTWKNGKSKSYMKYLPQIAGLFGVTIDWLVGSTRYRQEGLAEIYK